MPKVSLETLGRLIVAKRSDLGIRAAAQEIGISAATLSRVERGYLPDLETFRRICKWLELDSSEVLGLSPSRPSTPQVTVHFKKAPTLTAATAQALGQMVLAAHRAWLLREEEG